MREHERTLTANALQRLRDVPDIRVYGPDNVEDRAGVISFTLADIHPHDVAAILNEENVAVRAGHHCCQPLMDRLGLVGTARRFSTTTATRGTRARSIPRIFPTKTSTRCAETRSGSTYEPTASVSPTSGSPGADVPSVRRRPRS